MHTFYPANSRSLPPSLRNHSAAEPMLVRPQRGGMTVALSSTGYQRLRRPASSPARAIDPRLMALLDACD